MNKLSKIGSGWGPRGRAIAVVGVLLMSSLFFLGGGSRNASATSTTFYSDPTREIVGGVKPLNSGESLSKSRRGSRGIVVALAGLFLVSLLSGLLPMPIKQIENASATSDTFLSDGAMDGYLDYAGAIYPPWTTLTSNSASTQAWVLQDHLGDYTIDRTFVSFDTSALLDDVNILSATLRLMVYADDSWVDFDVLVYETSYLAWAPQWNATGGFQGVLFNTYDITPSNWYGMNVAISAINLTGTTQFMLKSSLDGVTPPLIPGHERMSFYTGDSAHAPQLIITYAYTSTPIFIELDAGGWTTWLNSTAYPEISEWNLTYDLYYFAIDTVPLSKNVTITKLNVSWTFKSVVPSCNYTETPTEVLLSDVYDSICYRVWFTVPKASPYATVHLSLYNAFTGEGFFWEQMRVQICDGATWDNTTVETVATPDFFVELEQTYTVRVLDYFGNMLVDHSFNANAQNVYVTISVPYYSWQIFNMNDQPILMQIYWNNSGAPWQFFVGPHWIIERFLKGGDYTFMTTFYDTTGVAGSTVYFNRTVPMTGLNASFVYVNGTTLYEVISSVEGVMAMQAIITSLVSPSMVIIYEDLPLAPVKLRSLSMSTRIAIDPYLILEATTYQNQTGLRFTNTSLWLPHAQVVASTYYNIADTLTFSGTFATNIFINDTAGTNLYTNTVLPAVVVLNGQNITVWADQNYSVSRASTFREISEYMVNYYSTQKKYETTISLNNTCPFDYYSPYWYIGFPQNTTIDQDTVTLFDLDNNIYLSQRTNFDVTAGGIHVTLNRLNSSNARNFRLTYWDANGTTGIGAPNLIAQAYTQGSLNGISMKYTSVQWTNPWSVSYAGEIYITLDFENGDNLLRTSIVIIDETTGNVIPANNYVYTGRTILILTDGVGSVGVGQGRNYGIYFTFDAEIVSQRTDFFFGPIIFQGQQFFISNYAVSWALILILIGWCLVGWRYWNDEKHHDAFMYLVIWSSVTIILFYFQSVMT